MSRLIFSPSLNPKTDAAINITTVHIDPFPIQSIAQCLLESTAQFILASCEQLRSHFAAEKTRTETCPDPLLRFMAEMEAECYP